MNLNININNNLGSRLQARVSRKALRSSPTIVEMDHYRVATTSKRLFTMTEAIVPTTTLSMNPVVGEPFNGPFFGAEGSK